MNLPELLTNKYPVNKPCKLVLSYVLCAVQCRLVHRTTVPPHTVCGGTVIGLVSHRSTLILCSNRKEDKTLSIFFHTPFAGANFVVIPSATIAAGQRKKSYPGMRQSRQLAPNLNSHTQCLIKCAEFVRNINAYITGKKIVDG